MPRLIFKCPYTKGGSERGAAHLENLVNYVATRDGVDKLQNYVDYIAMRPGAERQGGHGLFGITDEPVALAKLAKEIANHPGNVWKPIISLTREDAQRLGYDNGTAWRSLLRSITPQLAEAMKIKPENLCWYAAYHDHETHPHVHMVCYSTDPKEGYLSKKGIEAIKSTLAGRIFRQEQLCIYEKQTEYRNELTQTSRELLQQLCSELSSGTFYDPQLAELAEQLTERLRHTSGKKVYGYLKPELKTLVDKIVDRLAVEPRIAAAYDLWYQQRYDVLRTYTYTDTMPEKIPLSLQKEFKSVRNLVVSECARLAELQSVIPGAAQQPQDSSMDLNNEPVGAVTASEPQEKKTVVSHAPATALLATRLMHQLSKIFSEPSHPSYRSLHQRIDRKRQRILQEKKQAQGHAKHDREQEF